MGEKRESEDYSYGRRTIVLFHFFSCLQCVLVHTHSTEKTAFNSVNLNLTPCHHFTHLHNLRLDASS